MSNCSIKVGTFNKVLSIPFLLALFQIIITIYELFYPEKIKTPFVNLYPDSFGQIAIIIIPYIKCFSFTTQKKKAKCQRPKKKNCLHYFILLLLYSLNIFATSICNFFSEKKNYMNSIILIIFDILSTNVGIEIILITIIAKLLLKYEFYIHHYISIFTFLIFCVSIDLLLNNYSYLSNIKILEIFLNIINIVTKVVYYCYIKYMIDKHYHYYWNIMLSLGINQLAICIIINIYVLIMQKLKKNSITFIFFEYLNEVPIGIIISKFIISFIFKFIFRALEILTIFYLSPEFTFISENVAKLIIYLKEGNKYKYISIIFFICQFFCLMIYLEILELNFLKLNKNTKRNIKLRIEDEHIDRLDSFKMDKFETGEGYIFETEENESDNNLKVELNIIQTQDNQ